MIIYDVTNTLIGTHCPHLFSKEMQPASTSSSAGGLHSLNQVGLVCGLAVLTESIKSQTF